MDEIQGQIALGHAPYFKNNLAGLNTITPTVSPVAGFVLSDTIENKGVYLYDGTSWTKTAELPAVFQAYSGVADLQVIVDALAISHATNAENVGAAAYGVAGKAIPADADTVVMIDSENDNALTKTQVGNLRARFLASAALTGSPITTTAATSDNSSRIASTAFVQAVFAKAPSTDDFVAASQFVGQSSLARPGEAVDLFSADLTGAPQSKAPLSGVSAVSIVNSATLGRAVEVSGAEVTVAARQPVAIEPGRIYRPIFDVIRATDPADPAGHAIRFGVSWQGGAFAELDSDALAEDTRSVASGRWRPTLETWSLDMPQADNVIPSAANYAVAYVQTFGTDGSVRVGQVEFLDVTDEVLGAALDAGLRSDLADGTDASVLPDRLRTDEAALPYALAAKHGGTLIDFTNRAAVPVAINVDITAVADAAGGAGMIPTASDRRPVVDIYRGRRVARSEAVGTRLKIADDGNLLPPTGDMTLVFSHSVTETDFKATLWQHADDAPGRVQITSNGQYNGSSLSNVDGRLNFFLNGASGGGGFGEQPVSAPHPLGVPSVFAVVLRDGAGASEIWQNGRKIDTFTRPAALYDGAGYLFSHSSVDSYDAGGQIFGRVAVIESALSGAELDGLGAWAANALGVTWAKDVLVEIDYANNPISLFDADSVGDVWDFTAPGTYSNLSFGERVFLASGLRAEPVRLVPTTANRAPSLGRSSGRFSLVANTGSRLRPENFDPLLPPTGDMTLVFSLDLTNSARKAVIWQHATDEAGRVQITANALYNGSGATETLGRFNFFLNGAADGMGENGQPRAAVQVPGTASTYALVLREGTGASELWQGGLLVDTFTRPASLYDGTGYIFSDVAVAGYDETGQALGRMMVIDRALSGVELRLAGGWAAAAMGLEWRSTAKEEPLAVDTTADAVMVFNRFNPVGISEVSLYDEFPDLELYPASLTKAITAMVMLDNLSDMNATFTVIADDATGGSGNNLETGDIITVSDALYNMFLPSSNVTTTVVARSVGAMIGGIGTDYENFMAAANSKAAALGMTETVFTNASGLHNASMVTTARDMARMFMAVLEYPDILARWDSFSHDIVLTGADPRTETVLHSVDIIDDPYILGGKTGTTTAAGSNLAVHASMPGGHEVIMIVMSSASDAERYADARVVLATVRDGYDWTGVRPVRK
ncbi:serine hydrolase [uncultured Sulfitobacter sp.]|uniref:D-alanyl-D-alanine carboxypeptidase family protein n=1 Tax=uncultured Sulfitobacter sp. TaxID=191468 RepID=UPI00262AC363|nr:serine hydrolase [uncultured Sulfitobacter sp.]